jgi:transcriptional regulator with XRE-family HTH domain
MELKAELDSEGLTQAEFARKHGISRARVNQWMSLLGLPDREKRRLHAMGDNWDHQVVTERELRNNK